MITIERLDLADAGILLAGARAKSEEIGMPMCIAIVDESGNLIAFERMDGGKITSITIAIDKAYTAAAAKRATHEYSQARQPGSPRLWHQQCYWRPPDGGRRWLADHVAGAVVGGIGVSSGTPAQDQQVAEAGIDHFLATSGTNP